MNERTNERTNFSNVSIKYLAEGEPSATRGHLEGDTMMTFSYKKPNFLIYSEHDTMKSQLVIG